jgi:hypothetical protein
MRPIVLPLGFSSVRLRASCVLGMVLVAASAVGAVPAVGAPSNDDFVDAGVVGGPPATVTGSNVDATAESGEPGSNPDGRV